ncbi:MAG: hypothetical protein ACTHKY_12000 [Ginsengibacter sp.]
MIKTFKIIRPQNIPDQLLSFKFFFENVNTHIVDLYHAGGMNLVYKIERSCYLAMQNEFYQLLQLENREEPHLQKYNWLLVKGMFAEEPKIKARIIIENLDSMNPFLEPDQFNGSYVFLNKLPEPGNELVILDKSEKKMYHHFLCKEISEGFLDFLPRINLFYLTTYSNLFEVINLWCNEENKLKPLP